MYLRYLKIRNHPILKDIDFDFVNPKTNQPYPIIAFVGENGCGKTTLLNEIFDYAKSEYVFEREKPVMFSSVPHSSLFLRQNSLEKNAKKEIGKRIDGKDRYEVNSLNPFIFGLKTLNPLMEKEQGLRLLETLDDVEIYKLFKEGA